MITAINSINNQQSLAFQRRHKGINTKKIRKAFKELPYTLGIKKKKTVWEKIGDFFGIQKKSPVKKLKKNFKNGVDNAQPKRDNLAKELGKDFLSRIKRLDEVFFEQ